MSDRDAAAPSPSSPSQRTGRQLWPRNVPDWIIAVFTVVLALATLALVIVGIFQHFDTVDAVRATNRLADASEKTASAEFILKFDAMLAEHRYDRIIDDIESHDSSYQLPKYKNTIDADVTEYIGIFDDISSFISDNVISAKMAFDHFSYSIEKAWCNTTVQETIRKERATDKSKTAQSDPAYSDFEKIAKEYLEKDGPSCKDVEDSAPSAAQKKKKKNR